MARLVPCSKRGEAKRQMPDIAARLKKVFGERVIPDAAMDALMGANRGVF